MAHPWIQRHQHHESSLSSSTTTTTKSTPSSLYDNTSKLSPTTPADIHQRLQQQHDNDSKSTLSSSSFIYPEDVHYHEEFMEQHKRTTASPNEGGQGQPSHDNTQRRSSILVNKLHERQEKMNPSSMIIAREHCFIKGSFPKGAIRCKACQLSIRRNALVCEGKN